MGFFPVVISFIVNSSETNLSYVLSTSLSKVAIEIIIVIAVLHRFTKKVLKCNKV